MTKILIVDDQPEVRELLQITFDFNSHQIFTAKSGDEALKIAQAEHPDLIFLDIMMPDSTMNGLDVCQRLKSDPATADIKIIVISAKGQDYDKENAFAMGADDYFPKPFSPIALIEKLHEITKPYENH